MSRHKLNLAQTSPGHFGVTLDPIRIMVAVFSCEHGNEEELFSLLRAKTEPIWLIALGFEAGPILVSPSMGYLEL